MVRLPLDFPNSPVDGQIYENYVWNATDSVWQGLANQVVTAIASNTPTATFTDGYEYDCVIFKSNGTLTVTRGGLIDLLVVGGGGSGANGGFSQGGGGGAGGLVEIHNFYIQPGSYAVTVGAGGASPTSNINNQRGNPGGDSSIGTLVYGYGGGHGGAQGELGGGGGCGGGGSSSATTSFFGVVGGLGGEGTQGFNGGNGTGADTRSSGGGGGMGAVGANGTSNSAAGNGGVGATTTIIPTSLATSQSVGEVSGGVLYFAGGGGGGANSGNSTGGLGGGGRGGSTDNLAAIAGGTNTGGGGGGDGRVRFAPAGGSGVVIVRWRA